jgi:hypothetical protein
MLPFALGHASEGVGLHVPEVRGELALVDAVGR